jgi:hypothetical protein
MSDTIEILYNEHPTFLLAAIRIPDEHSVCCFASIQYDTGFKETWTAYLSKAAFRHYRAGSSITERTALKAIRKLANGFDLDSFMIVAKRNAILIGLGIRC